MQLLLWLLSLALIPSCALSQLSGRVDGDMNRPHEGALKAYLFNGSELLDLDVSGGALPAGSITRRYSGAIFLTRKGYIPEVVIVRHTDVNTNVGRTALKPLNDNRLGVLAGVVHKSVTGGKLQTHHGIAAFYRDVPITATDGKKAYTVTTDAGGAFVLVLPPGKYSIISDGKEAGIVTITEGETGIMNIRKSMVLVD